MHPPEELLVSVAAGEADVAHRAIVEAHAASCAECRAELAAMSAPGGALLAALPALDPPPALWDALLARLPATPSAALAPRDGVPVPAAAWAELPQRRPLRWRPLLVRGAWGAPLWHDRASGVTLLLAHMPGGRVFPRHRHPGGEDVVVLNGAYEDAYGRWGAGAFARYAPGSEHRPLTEPPEECWILTRLPRPIRFFGWRRVVQQALGAA